ncbi:unnamed protein product [Brassica rapa]|uniref:Cystatin domain-containing protein n=2 Tax=Brassica TaxID=3705 RepID=A0A3P6BMP6_BRACM|nr:unnamed protein product [Brassica napus]CAG7897751.1 unnamed protein product [Brassica rapa]CDY71661.1 BnaAnng38350D [Brassica napus]VDD03816.1 unnamed protein product [Brassica rapa]
MLKALICLCLILLPVISVVGEKAPPGRWKRIRNLDRDYFVNIAKFAVDEHNRRSKNKLVFIRILEGREQMDTGQRDYFKIGVRNSEDWSEIYEASVFDKEHNNAPILEFFRKIR